MAARRQPPPETAKRRIRAVVPKAKPSRSKREGRVMLSPETADVFRAVAKYVGVTLDELAQQMLQDYVRRHAPDLDLVYDDEDVSEADLRAAKGATSIFGNDPTASRKRRS